VVERQKEVLFFSSADGGSAIGPTASNATESAVQCRQPGTTRQRNSPHGDQRGR
jgi:hypothetical protein